MAIGLLLMAAGRSRRFKAAWHGVHKLLYRQDASAPCILEVTYQKVCEVLDPSQICVVVNDAEPDVRQLAEKLGSPILVVCSQGVGESIAQAVTAHQNWSGILILHADLPFIQKETIQSVVDALNHHAIVRPIYQNHPGHPVGFQQAFYPKLMTLQGDRGANTILTQQAVTLIHVQDRGVLHDIDEPSDLA